MVMDNRSQVKHPIRRLDISLHGEQYSCRIAGSGSTIVLLHGIAASSATWEKVIPRLVEHHTVVAPDLLGHGESAKPPGDYSLGAYANLLRDLLGGALVLVPGTGVIRRIAPGLMQGSGVAILMRRLGEDLIKGARGHSLAQTCT